MRNASIVLACALTFVNAESWPRCVGESFAESLQAPAAAPNKSMEIPRGSVFAPPPANACESNYDRFYGAEPGVYAYWALCEAGKPAQIYDYVGQFDLTSGHSFGSGVVAGGAPGPVPDGESAASVQSAGFSVEGQGIPLNTHQGTVSAWINADATPSPVTAVYFGAVSGKSLVSVGVKAGTGICFNGDYTDAKGTSFIAEKCGYAANTWHRVTFVWSAMSSCMSMENLPQR